MDFGPEPLGHLETVLPAYSEVLDGERRYIYYIVALAEVYLRSPPVRHSRDMGGPCRIRHGKEDSVAVHVESYGRPDPVHVFQGTCPDFGPYQTRVPFVIEHEHDPVPLPVIKEIVDFLLRFILDPEYISDFRLMVESHIETYFEPAGKFRRRRTENIIGSPFFNRLFKPGEFQPL